MSTRIAVGLFAVALLVACAAVTSQAQVAKGDMFVGPGAGVALPLGNFSDAAGIGFAVGGSGDYVVTDNIAVGADLFINFFGGKSMDVMDSKWKETPRIIRFGGHGKYFFTPQGPTVPFATAGLALYNDHVSVSGQSGTYSVGGSASTTDFGINLGGGVMINAGEKMKLAIQGLFHDIFSSGSSAQYVSAGATLFFPIGAKK